MKWWYEPEDNEMKTCKECGHKDCPNYGGEWYTLDCPNNELKGVSMEFDKDRVYTALNADELRAGDKVIVADTLDGLKHKVQEGKDILVLQGINPETWGRRFSLTNTDYALAYLVERKENCTNCKYSNPHKNLLYCEDDNIPIYVGGEKLSVCDKYKPKTEKEDNMNWNYESLPERQENGVSDHVIVAVEGCPYGQSGYYDYDMQAWFVDGCSEPVKVEAWQKVELPKIEKAEKHYRPFKDTDELIKVWCEYKCPAHNHRERGLTLPFIWIRRKNDPKDKGRLITAFNDDCVEIGEAGSGDVREMGGLFEIFEFLDGSPCGVEE